MAVDLKDIMLKWQDVEQAGNAISMLAAGLGRARTSDGTTLHADTLSTMRAKIPELKIAYENADVAFRAAMTP